MAEIHNSASKRCYEGSSDEDNDQLECTLQKELLKKLHENQMKTDVSLDQIKKVKRKFITVSKEESLPKNLSGLKSLNQFNYLADENELQSLLVKFDLTITESKLLLKYIDKDLLNHPKQSYQCSSLNKFEKSSIEPKNSENEAAVTHLMTIKSVLSSLDNHLNHCKKEGHSDSIQDALSLKMTRSEMDILSGVSSKLTECLNNFEINTSNCVLTKTLKELENNLMKRAFRNVSKKKLKRMHINIDQNQVEFPKNTINVENIRSPYKSLWDCTEMPRGIFPKKFVPQLKDEDNSSLKPNQKDELANLKRELPVQQNVEESEYSKEKSYSKPFVMVLDSKDLIPIEDILANKTSLEDLIKMDKFKNYSSGTLNNVLYAKNLPKKVQALKIASLFGHFESPPPYISYRLLTGRMKGQAFITFKNKNIAARALEVCNGYLIDDKPIVLAYGNN